MLIPKYENITEEYNLDRGMKDFNNSQHVTIYGEPLKSSKLFGKVVSIRLTYARKKGKYGFSYFLTNEKIVLNFDREYSFEYDSIQALYQGIIEELKIYINKNFKKPKFMIVKLENYFTQEIQGYLNFY